MSNLAFISQEAMETQQYFGINQRIPRVAALKNHIEVLHTRKDRTLTQTRMLSSYIFTYRDLTTLRLVR